MNRPLLALVLASTLALAACGADDKTIDGVTYGTYGLVNKEEMRNPNIQYEISGWSIFWSIVFSETIIAPVYFIGWDLYQPVGKKDPNAVPGQVK
jgi:major membrane immunogen (membrane-anchored lipoprotein)